jgi:hypothetical protein
LREVANDRQAVELAFAGLEDGDKPKDEEAEEDHQMQQLEKHPAEWNEVHTDLQRRETELQDDGSDAKSNGLHGVEADKAHFVVGLDQQKDDGWDHCEICDSGGGIL